MVSLVGLCEEAKRVLDVRLNVANAATVASFCAGAGVSAGASVNQLSPNVRHDVGRHHALDVVHQKERSSQHVVPVVSIQHSAGWGTSVSLSDRSLQLRSSRYVGNTGIGGRRPRHQLLLDRSPVLLPPASIKMMVSDDMPVESTPLSTVSRRPTGQHARQPARYHAGSGHVALELESVDGSDCRFVGHTSLGTATSLGKRYESRPAPSLTAPPAPGGRVIRASTRRSCRRDGGTACADRVFYCGRRTCAGTTKSALYRRWSSKAELVHEAASSRPPRCRLRPVISSTSEMIAATRDVHSPRWCGPRYPVW